MLSQETLQHLSTLPPLNEHQRNLVMHDEGINAIKSYRETFNCSLIDAKNKVELFRDRLTFDQVKTILVNVRNKVGDLRSQLWAAEERLRRASAPHLQEEIQSLRRQLDLVTDGTTAREENLRRDLELATAERNLLKDIIQGSLRR